MSSNVTVQLAEFAHRLRMEDIPREVIEKVRQHTIDLLGCAVLGATMPWSKIVERYGVTHGAAGNATVILSGAKVDAEFAAMANATASHAFEMDDYHQAPAHPASCAVPAALAIAEEQSRSGEEFMLATIVGFEVIIRIAEAAWPEAMTERGFHTSCAQGVFGAAAAAGKLAGLDQAQMLTALGLAGSHASGTVEYSQTGGEVKRYHAGLGAAGGVRSARLAAMGLSAPPTILEGPKGFLQAFSPAQRADSIVANLGKDWRLMGTCLKPYCCCALTHSVIDALLLVIAEHDLHPSDVDQIIVGCSRQCISITGAVGPEPKGMSSAQFSTHFALALTLTYRANDYGAYQRSFIAGSPAPELVKLAQRVRLEWDDECEQAFPRQFLAKVEVRTRDGRVLRAKSLATGTPDKPFTLDDVERKFIAHAEVVMPNGQAHKLLEMLKRIETLPTVAPLTSLLTVGQAANRDTAALQPAAADD